MKLVAISLGSAAAGLALLLAASLTTSGPKAQAASPAPAAKVAFQHQGDARLTDDPVPMDCPFCGGDPVLHARRINAIAYGSAQLAYRLLDDSIF